MAELGRIIRRIDKVCCQSLDYKMYFMHLIRIKIGILGNYNSKSVFSCPSFSISLVVKIPCLSNHKLKVCIIINWGTNIRIIVHEFIQCHFMISFNRLLITLGKTSVCFKCFQEVIQGLISCDFTFLYIWMSWCIIEVLYIWDI